MAKLKPDLVITPMTDPMAECLNLFEKNNHQDVELYTFSTLIKFFQQAMEKCLVSCWRGCLDTKWENQVAKC